MIRPARPSDIDALARLRHALWPDGSVEEHRRELEAIFGGTAPGILPEITFVFEEEGRVVAFADAALRSYADGCETSPVGYLEGWFVAESHRRRGIGAALLRAAEDWARAQGCTEMASDTWLEKELAQRAHEALGFEEVDRVVQYRKRL
jgi:aminoglycoside 6'-N-acetyltransferase I